MCDAHMGLTEFCDICGLVCLCLFVHRNLADPRCTISRGPKVLYDYVAFDRTITLIRLRGAYRTKRPSV